ncbi:MAG: nucleoside hydrolase [Candidatus Brocadiaceae bacterium]
MRIVSTDVGIDDALALVFLHRSGGAAPDFVVATGGNVPRQSVLNNCIYLRDLFDWDAEVFSGTDPAPPPVRDAAEVHGPHGLGDRRSPHADAPPLSSLAERLAQAESPFDLLVLGPATDAATLLGEPKLARRCRRVTLMGGAFEPRGERLGNVTPFAEFNVYMDPGAAWRVTGSGTACEFVPLDCTERRLFGTEELLAGVGSGPRAELVANLVAYLREAHVRLGEGDGVFMHDVVAAALWAQLIRGEWREAELRQIVRCGERRGMMITNDDGGRRIRYAHSFDEATFLTLWRQVVASL